MADSKTIDFDTVQKRLPRVLQNVILGRMEEIAHAKRFAPALARIRDYHHHTWRWALSTTSIDRYHNIDPSWVWEDANAAKIMNEMREFLDSCHESHHE